MCTKYITILILSNIDNIYGTYITYIYIRHKIKALNIVSCEKRLKTKIYHVSKVLKDQLKTESLQKFDSNSE
jgi:hypothetical protein